MQKPLVNSAFVDGQNVNIGIQEQGWKLDWKKFRIYLREKYAVKTAYLFLGFLEQHQDLYNALQKAGFVIVFKEALIYKDGKIKGNCDAELVLQAMIDYNNYVKAVIVSGDGDFACLVRYLEKVDKLECILILDQKNYSALLKKTGRSKLAFMNLLREKLSYKKRTP